MGVWVRPAVAQSFARQIPLHGVFVLVTMDRVTWQPYEYGTGFFFDAVGDAYTASNVVRDAVKDPYLMLVALVDGAEYAVHVDCWNPGSTDRPRTPNRDVAVVHVGPDVPDFPLWSYRPATVPSLRRPAADRRGWAADRRADRPRRGIRRPPRGPHSGAETHRGACAACSAPPTGRRS